MILNDKQLTVEPVLLRTSDLLDTIADLKRQLAQQEAAVAAKDRWAENVVTLLRNGPRSTEIRRELPELAAALDAYAQEKVDRKLAERGAICGAPICSDCGHCEARHCRYVNLDVPLEGVPYGMRWEGCKCQKYKQ